MLLVNQTDYPQAFRLLQTIALGGIVFTVCDFLLGRRRAEAKRQEINRDHMLKKRSMLDKSHR